MSPFSKIEQLFCGTLYRSVYFQLLFLHSQFFSSPSFSFGFVVFFNSNCRQSGIVSIQWFTIWNFCGFIRKIGTKPFFSAVQLYSTHRTEPHTAPHRVPHLFCSIFHSLFLQVARSLSLSLFVYLLFQSLRKIATFAKFI